MGWGSLPSDVYWGVKMGISGRISAATLFVAMMAAASPAQATDTFAQFAQLLPNARIFTYTNASSGGIVANLGTIGSTNTVLISDLGSLASPSIAKVNLVGSATVLPAIAANITQLFSGSLTFTLLVPQLGMSGPSTNALTVTFTNALLVAAPGGASPTLQADVASGSVITYWSDFADLSDTDSENFSLSFSGSSTPLTLALGRLPNFRVSGSGTFAAALVPEPASWGLMLVGFGAIGGALRSRRKVALSFS